MRVKCVICDKIESIDDDSFQAKRLRNRPINTYMCESCSRSNYRKNRTENCLRKFPSIRKSKKTMTGINRKAEAPCSEVWMSIERVK